MGCDMAVLLWSMVKSPLCVKRRDYPTIVQDGLSGILGRIVVLSRSFSNSAMSSRSGSCSLKARYSAVSRRDWGIVQANGRVVSRLVHFECTFDIPSAIYIGPEINKGRIARINAGNLVGQD